MISYRSIQPISISCRVGGIYSKISGPVRSNLAKITQERPDAVETTSSGGRQQVQSKGSRFDSKDQIAMPTGQPTWRELSGVPEKVKSACAACDSMC